VSRSVRWCTALAACVVFSASCGSDDADSAPSDTGGSSGAAGTSTSGGGTTASGGGGTGGLILDGGGGSPTTCPHCSNDLHAIVSCDGSVKQTCLGSEGCDTTTVKCTNACQAAESAKRSVGCEYYAVFMDQIDESSCFAAFVANTWDTPAQLTVEYDGQTLPLGSFAYLPVGFGPTLTYAPLGGAGLPPGKVAILFLAGPDGTPGKDNPVCPKPSAVPSGAMLFNKTGKGKAFRITSDVPIVAYQMNPYGGGSAAVTGASLLIPTSAWNTDYVAIHGYESGPQFASMNIVAKEPTTITMRPTHNIVGGGGLPPGSAKGTYTVSLQAGEHVQFTQLESLAGSPITADKPIGFMAGGRCSQIPSTVYACDHVEQMIPPVSALGFEYVGVSHKSRSGEPALWRIMGVADGTTLTWSSDVGGPSSLKLGEIVEFTTQFPFFVKSQNADHPFLLMAHMTGGSTNNMQGVGDADAVLAVPPAQFLTSYLFFTDPTYPVTDLVVVRAPDAGKFHDVTLDCAGALSGWKPVGGYEYTRIDLTTGDFQQVGTCSTGAHEMHSDGKFGVWVWGWGSSVTSSFTEYVSYGYPAGMNIQKLNEIQIPK